MQQKAIHLGTDDKLALELANSADVGDAVVSYLGLKPSNFAQVGFGEKVDLRYINDSRFERDVYCAHFCDTKDGTRPMAAFVATVGHAFFKGHDDDAFKSLVRQIDRAPSTEANLKVLTGFTMYAAGSVKYRLTKDHESIQPVVYAGHMIHRLAGVRGDDKIASGYVGWMLSAYAREFTSKNLDAFAGEPNFTRNRLALAMIKNDIKTDKDISGMEGATSRYLIKEWMDKNIADIKECEELMATKDFCALV